MKTLILTLAILCSLSINSANLNAQPINISGSTGIDGNYSSLTSAGGAFDALNTAVSQTGKNIVILITGDVLTETGAISLNAKDWTTLTINPDGGAARTISGTIDGAPLISLNGADNVNINGLNSGGNSLTIANLSTSSASGTSTIRFQADASNNIISNCSVLGSSTYLSTATISGNILFGSAAITTGNDNNTISNCNIGPSSAGLPLRCIYFSGSSNSEPGTGNSGNVISGNNIFDFFSTAGSSIASGITVRSGTPNGTFTNNKFYQTASRTSTRIQSCIDIDNDFGNGYLITDNTMGFSSSSGTGNYTLVSTEFYPIYIRGLGSSIATSIQGNTITAIAISGGDPLFAAIYLGAGLVNVGTVTGNQIGSLTGATAITYTSTIASQRPVYGCQILGGAVCTVSNNSFGNITANNTSVGYVELYGIHVNNGVGIITNNTIGSSAGPLTNSSSRSPSLVNGIRYYDPGAVITGNTIRNLTTPAQTGSSGASSSVVGINLNSAASSTTNLISQNTIQNLSNTNTNSGVKVAGIVYNGSPTGTHTIERNLIHSFNLVSSSSSAAMTGIAIVGGKASYQNNMIALGLDVTSLSSSISNGIIINGISESGTNSVSNIYYNSIYIGGTGVVGTANTFAFQSTTSNNTRNYVNNIFLNARSNGAGTGKHYAINVAGTAPNPTGLTSNYNDMHSPGTGGVLGLFNAVDQSTLAAWQTAVGQDANSTSVPVSFVDPANGDLHLDGSSVGDEDLIGTPIPGITTDIDGDPRDPVYPYMGADEADVVLPVELVSFTSIINNGDVTLNWTTLNEFNNSGFDIERSNVNGQMSNNWIKVGNVKGYGTTSNSNNYTFTDRNLSSGKYNYRLKQIDFNANFEYYNLNGEVNIGIPAEFYLSQNYPNPFNPTTKINYDLPFDSKVSIKLFDISGREIATLVNEEKIAGYHTINYNASNLSSGVYFYKIQAGDFSMVKRMMLVK